MKKITIETTDNLAPAIGDVEGWRTVSRVRHGGHVDLFVPPEINEQAIRDAVDNYSTDVETTPTEQS